MSTTAQQTGCYPLARNREPWTSEPTRIHPFFTDRDFDCAKQLLDQLDGDVLAALNCVRIAALCRELDCHPDEAVMCYQQWRADLPDSMD